QADRAERQRAEQERAERERAAREAERGKGRQARQGASAVRPDPSKQAAEPDEAEQGIGDFKPLSTTGTAVVVSVVDERTLGPVTRSRLTLRVQPAEGEPFEVTTRVAFPTPEARASVKVGGSIPVRYDPADHRRVVVDMIPGTGG
ncbi:MAG TPA: hypothetical protein VED59_01260, partial [Acidimicrobiales bacterium]|nr:hypothetical protein [Acidimicrobiales bacterium]